TPKTSQTPKTGKIRQKWTLVPSNPISTDPSNQPASSFVLLTPTLVPTSDDDASARDLASPTLPTPTTVPPSPSLSTSAPLPTTPTHPSAHLHQTNLANATSQPVRWLWQQRLPLTGLTLLDGDHGTGKSLLSLRIAAAVSSGSPMPDGTPTIQG